jgi:hypothetical protein
MTTILAIDPGLARCGVVLYDGLYHRLLGHAILEPSGADFVAERQGRLDWTGNGLSSGHADYCVIEHVGHYGTGMNVGKDVFDTCVLIGELRKGWNINRGKAPKAALMLRPDVKTYLCRKRGATDAMVRQAVLDRFPRTGGGKTPQVGVKDQPGPLYGVKGDAWQALALAITYAETVLELPALRVVPGESAP